MSDSESTDTKLNEHASLDECLKYLHKPSLDRNPPRSCYKKLDFPNDIGSKQPRMASYHQYFNNKFKNVTTISPLKAYQSGKIFITYQLEKELKQKKLSRYTLIPIEYYHQNLSQPNGYFGLIYDKNSDEWEMFRFPGTNTPLDFDQIENKIRTWLQTKIKIPVWNFYQTIYFQPPQRTIHYHYWPSWLIYHKIKYPNRYREQTVNLALEKILKRSSEYRNFMTEFQRVV